MKRKVLISIVLLLALIISSCSSTGSKARDQEEKPESTVTVRSDYSNAQKDIDTSEKTAEKRAIHYKDLSLYVPSDWIMEETEDDCIQLYRTRDGGFYCLVEAHDISGYIDADTTKKDVQDYCFQIIDNIEGIKNLDYRKDQFKGCPAVFFSMDEDKSYEYEGVSFIADTCIYIISIASALDEDDEEDIKIAREIQNSISIDPNVNITRYESTTVPDNNMQSVVFKDLTLSIPHDWKAEETEDGIMSIQGTSNKGFGCMVSAFDISEFVDENTTKNDIYDYCLQKLIGEHSKGISYEKGQFKGCPAINFSCKEGEEDTPVEFEGVCFVADTCAYLFAVGSALDEDHNSEKSLAQQVQNSIVIDPKLNISRYETASARNENAPEENNTVPDTKTTPDELAFEKEVIFDGHDIQISTDNIIRDSTSTSFVFLIENNSDTDYSINIHSWDLNGIMMGSNQYGSGSVDVPTGKKTKLKITADNNILNRYGINAVSELNVIFWAYGDSSKEWDTGLINIKTNLYSEEHLVTVNKDPNYSDDSVDVWYSGCDSNNNYSFIILNKTRYNASYTIENCSVNDWSYQITDYTFDLYNELINSGAYVEITLPIDDEFMSSNEIEKIENIEFDVLLEDYYWNYEGEKWEHKTKKIAFTEF